MIVSDISLDECTQHLRSTGLKLNVGPFWCDIKSALPSVAHHITELYPDALIDQERVFSDFPIEIARKSGVRGWIKPLVEFTFNGNIPFTPLSLDQSPALTEWGINWCVSGHANQYLILHAAVVEKNGKAVILPAPSGSGKSTLCVALVSRGWRLLSDELTLISIKDSMLQPLPKPMSLKNESIQVIRDYWPQSVFGHVCTDTVKGSVAHVKPPVDSVNSAAIMAKAAFVIFPKYQQGSSLQLVEKEKAFAYMSLVENAFNYHLLGAHAFHALSRLVNQVEAYDFLYSDLNEAVARFESLVT
ncbi:HprK-related kinase A [Neptunomonas antarctica]|uniref:Hpr(Ser) kinase/phosphatase n=1 Tax=Neptunomonas antarctica TaxID=619304 RepID=A0A1N7JF24_9GAMM|nr:HprK-related kinase A [Neptunomonas antarctica]SIS47972.1 Hpr(Ser) kinase/phosphatase [Neptunomonas antarctica]